jgi:hypothetical protein
MNTLVPDRLPECLAGKTGLDCDVAELVRDTERSAGVTILPGDPGSDWCVRGVNAYPLR